MWLRRSKLSKNPGLTQHETQSLSVLSRPYTLGLVTDLALLPTPYSLCSRFPSAIQWEPFMVPTAWISPSPSIHKAHCIRILQRHDASRMCVFIYKDLL